MFDPPRYIDPHALEPMPDWPSIRHVYADSSSGLTAALDYLHLTPRQLARRLSRNTRLRTTTGEIKRACVPGQHNVSLVIVAVTALVHCDRVRALSRQRSWVEELMFGPQDLFTATAESYARRHGKKIGDAFIAELEPHAILEEVLTVSVDVANALNWSRKKVPLDDRIQRFTFLNSPASDEDREAFADSVTRAFIKFGVVPKP